MTEMSDHRDCIDPDCQTCWPAGSNDPKPRAPSQAPTIDLPALYEARALIAEGRAHDEVAHRRPPDCDCADRGEPDQNGHEPTCPLRQYGQALLAAAAWKEAHFTELLDGCAELIRIVQIDVVEQERQRQAELTKLREQVERQAWQDRVWKQIDDAKDAELARLRAALHFARLQISE